MYPEIRNFAQIIIGSAPNSPDTCMFIQRGDQYLPCHLWLVTLTRGIPGQYPLVSLCYVIAPSPEEAIAQVENNAFPESPGCTLDAEQRAHLHRTASAVPVHIRGWGRQTF